MPSVNITQELRDIIKEERKKRDISTVKLSTLLKKGKAYVSQIESGKISTIDLRTFYAIFEEIIDMPDDKRNEYIQNNILDKISINLSSEEIKKQEWIITFDMKVRQFPISNLLRQLIINKRTDEKVNKTPEDLVLFINENHDLDNKDEYMPNQLSVKINPNGLIEEAIRFDLPLDFIKKIENGSMKTISYIDMQGVLYNLFRLEGKNPFDSLEETKILLRDNGFLTLSEREKVVRDNFSKKLESNEDFKLYDLEPTELEKEYAKIMEEIISGFKFLRTRNIIYAHKQINQLLKNMKSDIGLMFAIFGLSLDKLEVLDFETKEKLIQDIKKVVSSYSPPLELDSSSSEET